MGVPQVCGSGCVILHCTSSRKCYLHRPGYECPFFKLCSVQPLYLNMMNLASGL